MTADRRHSGQTETVTTGDDEQLATMFTWNARFIDPDYLAYGKHRAQMEFAQKLFEYLHRPGFDGRYTVVKLDERDYVQVGYDTFSYRIDAYISEARQQHIVIPKVRDMPTAELYRSAWQELKYRFTRWITRRKK